MLTELFQGAGVVFFLPGFLYFPMISHKHLLAFKLAIKSWKEEGTWPPKYEEGPYFIKQNQTHQGQLLGSRPAGRTGSRPFTLLGIKSKDSVSKFASSLQFWLYLPPHPLGLCGLICELG